MTDEEVICAFMEPVPPFPPWSWQSDITWGHPSPEYWHFPGTPTETGLVHGAWIPRHLDLDHLHKVEERLSDDQWWAYEAKLKLIPLDFPVNAAGRVLIHATTAHKIKALAWVLRDSK